MAYELKATLKLIDEMSAPMRRVARTVTELNNEVRTVTSSLEAMLNVQKRVNKSLSTMALNIERYGNALKNTSKDRSKAVNNLVALGNAADKTTSKYKLLRSAMNEVHNRGGVGTSPSMRNTSQGGSGGGRGSANRPQNLRQLLGGGFTGHMGHFATNYVMSSTVQLAETMMRTGFSQAISGIQSAMETEFSTIKLASMIPKGDRDSFSKANNGLPLNQAFGKQALDLSYHTMYSRNELIAIQKELYKSGMDYDTILKHGGLEQTAYLGVAGEMDWKDAVTAMAASLNMFKSQKLTAKQAADSLAVNADVSASDVSGLYMGQRAFGPTAAMYKMKYDDMNTLLGILSNAGIKDKTAGTTLKYMYDYIVNPRNNKAGEAMQKLGWLRKDGSTIFWDRKNNKIQDIDYTFAQLQKSYEKYEKMGKTDQLAGLFKTAFGQYSKNAALIFGLNGVKSYQDYVSKKTGLTAGGIHNQMMDSTPGALKQLTNTWDNFKSVLATPFLPAIKTSLGEIAKIFQESVGPLQQGANEMGNQLVGWWKKNISDPLKMPDMKEMNIIDKFSFMISRVADGIDKFLQTDSGKKLTAALTKLMGVIFRAITDILIGAVKSAVLNKETAGNVGKGIVNMGTDHLIISSLIGAGVINKGINITKGIAGLFRGGAGAMAGVEGAGGAAGGASLLSRLGPWGMYAALAYGSYKLGSGPLADGVNKAGDYFDKKHAEKIDAMYNKAMSDPVYLQSGGKFDNSSIPKETTLAPASDRSWLNEVALQISYALNQAYDKATGKEPSKTEVKNEQKIDQHYQINIPVHIEEKTDKEGIINMVVGALQNALPNKTSTKGTGNGTFKVGPVKE